MSAMKEDDDSQGSAGLLKDWIILTPCPGRCSPKERLCSYAPGGKEDEKGAVDKIKGSLKMKPYLWTLAKIFPVP